MARNEEEHREQSSGPVLLEIGGGKRTTIAFLLALLAFLVSLVLALRLAGLGVVDQYDVMFHADTGARIDCVVRNDCAGRSSFAHPGLALFLNPPIRGAAAVLTFADSSTGIPPRREDS